MKYFTIVFITFFYSTLSLGQGIDFFHGTLEEALEEAKDQDKIVFVDAYTTWCGPCKRMAKNVFTDASVGTFFNEHFISMKIDMEKPAGRLFKKKYPVSAFPTYYFIDENGESVLTTKGAMPPEKFVALGESAVGKVDYSADFATAYKKGDRDPELVYNYVKALNKSGKPSLKIANEYIKSQKDMTSEQNLRFLLEASTEADSRIFGLMIKNKSKIVTLTSKEEVNKKIEKACKKTAAKAIEYKSVELHEEAKSKMKANYPEKAEVFAFSSDMKFYKATEDAKGYLKVSSSYTKKVIKNDANQLHKLAQDIYTTFGKDAKAMKQAEKLAKTAAENGGLYNYYFTYADILHKNGKKSEALKMANKSLNLIKENPREASSVQQLIKTIEES